MSEEWSIEDLLNEVIDEEHGKMLIFRVTEAVENGTIRRGDWMKIYEILLEATHRDRIELEEKHLRMQIEGCDCE